MAFEFGVLAHSDGRSPREAMVELQEHLQANASGVSFEGIEEGEMWASTEVHVDRLDTAWGQYVQISVGGEILETTIKDARSAIDERSLAGMDLVLESSLSGRGDPEMNEVLLDYARTTWHGVFWDEASGFQGREYSSNVAIADHVRRHLGIGASVDDLLDGL